MQVFRLGFHFLFLFFFFYYLYQNKVLEYVMFLPGLVCVCLSVSRITQRLMNEFQNFLEGSGVVLYKEQIKIFWRGQGWYSTKNKLGFGSHL